MLPASDETLNKLGIVSITGRRKSARGVWVVVIRTRAWIEVAAEAETFDDALDQAITELVSNPDLRPN